MDESRLFSGFQPGERGMTPYIQAQEGLMRRCDGRLLEPVCSGAQWRNAFVEWTDGPENQGVELFIRHHSLCIGANGKIPLSFAT